MSKISPRLRARAGNRLEADRNAGVQPEAQSKYTILHNIPVFFKYAREVFKKRRNYLCYNLRIAK
jgi:hypothetical protein